jgi:hypothetical protein
VSDVLVEINPTDWMVPKIGCAAPVAPAEPLTVNSAWSPAASDPTWESSTLTLAFQDPVPTTTNWALDEELLLDPPLLALLPDPVPDPVPEPPAPAAPADPPEPEVPVPDEAEAAAVELVEADTFCPTVRFTEATIPSIGEASVAEFSAVCAMVTSAWATAMAA